MGILQGNQPMAFHPHADFWSFYLHGAYRRSPIEVKLSRTSRPTYFPSSMLVRST